MRHIAIITCVLLATGLSITTQAAAPPPSTNPANPRETPIVLAYRKARPAVVSISAEKVINVGTGIFGSDVFEDIFPTPGRRVPVESLGSGVVLHPDGYVVTNAHVVRCAEKVNVTLCDKTQLPAKVVVVDPEHDFAILKVECKKQLDFLPLGRSDDLMVGETIVAIGNPMGYSNSVSTGVISSVGRTMEFPGGVTYKDLIQIDAPINPGNSGGPLLNVNGELIGINVAIRADAQNIGFAIPIDSLAAVLGNLLDFERINRVVFGATISTRHGKSGEEVFVSQVRKGTPADTLLEPGDLLVSANGRAIRQIPDFSCLMFGVPAGEKLALKVLRKSKEVSVELAMTARPKPDGKAMAQGLMGMSLKPINAEVAKDLGLKVTCGLVVTALDAGGPADKLGVKVKDVIFQIDKFLVNDYGDLGTVLEDISPGQIVRLGVVRANVRVWTPMTTRKSSGTSATSATKPTE